MSEHATIDIQIQAEKTKVCLRCGEEKPVTEFHRDGIRSEGVRPYCKACRCAEEKKRRDAAPPREVRKCRRCKAVKPIGDFGLQDRASSLCGECRAQEYKGRPRTYKKYKRKPVPWTPERAAMSAFRRYDKKHHYLNLLGGKCKSCGIEVGDEWPPSCFDFHHTDPVVKDTEISKLLTRNGKDHERVVKELDNCIVLCSNCHRRLHYRERYADYKQTLDKMEE